MNALFPVDAAQGGILKPSSTWTAEERRAWLREAGVADLTTRVPAVVTRRSCDMSGEMR